jgi:segregation and condensation protein A
LDLIIPANIILAAAILLRYKSEVLRFEETAQQQIDEQPPTQFFPDDIPQLTLASRIPPKRQITLDELTAEMERIIKYETTERTVKRRAELEIVSIKLNGIDLEKKMEEVLELIRKNVDNERWALFSRITKGKKKDEVAFYLLSLLHLTQKRMIDIRQDKMWDEIFIYLL